MCVGYSGAVCATAYQLDGVELIEGDSLEVLPTLGEHEAIVTSPPYADVRADVKSASPSEYVEWLSPFLELLWPCLVEGGGFMLNLGRVFRDGVESSYAERVLIRAEEIGWKRVDTIVWAKINGRPINPYLTNVHETVYWLTRGDALSAYRGFEGVRYPYAPETLLRYQRKWTNHANRKSGGKPEAAPVQDGRVANENGSRPRSIFVTQVGKLKGIKHPTPMALDLAQFLVCLSCPPGGKVLDPFFGSGTTGVAARALDRRCVGIDRSSVFVQEAHARLGQDSLRW